MQPEFPHIAIRLDRFRFAREVAFVVMFYVSLPNKRLKIRAEPHPIGRVHVDHLYLSTHPLVFEERVHNDQAVAENETVYPVIAIFVGLENLIGDWVTRIAEEVEHVGLFISLVALQCFQDRLCGKTLVHE